MLERETTSNPVPGSTEPLHVEVAVEKISIEKLSLWGKNPRTIKDKRFKALCKSLRDDPAFMELRPILATKEGRIYAGNMRYRAAKELGWTEVPAILTDIDEKLANERAIKDNNEFGEWNNDELATLLDEMEKAGSDIESLGLDDAIAKIITQLNEAEIVEDEVPEPPKDPKTKVGDMYVLGKHKLMCGDATKMDDVEKLMAGELSDLVFTDPPYGVAYVGKTKESLTIQNDALGDEGTRQLVADSLKIAPMKSGACFYVCSPPGNTETAFRLAIQDSGLTLKQCIVWVKDHFVMGRQDYHWRHESILYGWREGAAHFYGGGRTQDTVWECKRPTVNKEHPTMKPIELVAKAIKNNTKGDDIVYDCFGGSGSTLVACEQLDRKCRTLEIDPRYCDVIVSRWEKLTGQKAKLA